MNIKFTDNELSLLKACFDINGGDTYVRETLFPQWLKEDCNLSEKQTEKLFESIDKKFTKWIEEEVNDV